LKNKLLEILYAKKLPSKKPLPPLLSDELVNKYTFEKTVSRILDEFQ